MKLRQGPALWGKNYAKLIADFEAVARREHITCLREGAPDLDENLKAWRASLQAKTHKP